MHIVIWMCKYVYLILFRRLLLHLYIALLEPSSPEEYLYL